MNLCVYGASSDKIKKIYIEKTEELGEKMAKRGHTLVFGAGNGGCMGAAARGADRGKGRIVGVVPSFFDVDGVLYPHCDELVQTETMRQRKQILEERSDAFIVAPGGIGTYDEFFEIVTLKQLERHDKAIAIFNVDGYYNELENILKKLVADGFMQEEAASLVMFFDDADKLLDYVEAYEPQNLKTEDLKYLSKLGSK